MSRRTLLLLLTLLSGHLCLLAQQAAEKAAPQSAPRDAYQSGWRQADTRSEAELWKEISLKQPQNAGAQFNWYRSERNARLSNNNGRLSTSDQQALGEIARKVGAAAPQGFEDQVTAYYQAFPAPAAFDHLRQAAALAPERPELIGPMLNMANLNGDKASLDRWCREMEVRGEPSDAQLRAVSDLLASTDRDAILFTNGDMDTQLALVRQRRKDDRRDVLIIDQRLLADLSYRQRMWGEAGAKGPIPAAGTAFALALSKASARPVHLAMTLDRNWLDAFQGRLSTAGTAFRVDGNVPLTELDARWKRMHKPVGALPISRNYLLPGAVLLKGYRALGDEARTAQLELELRALARKLGAESDLVRAGVLEH